MQRREKGQSLVELAIFTPLLIFLLIGLFEIGYAIRHYYVILNASRETARFTARPGYLELGFDQTVSHTQGALNEPMRAKWDEYGSVQVIVLKAFTGRPDCDSAPVYTMTRQVYVWPDGAIIEPPIDITQTHEEIAEYHYQLSCEMMAASNSYAPFPEIEAVVATVCYEHHQLFGFPVISNPLLDPVVLCADTIMRRMGQQR